MRKTIYFLGMIAAICVFTAFTKPNISKTNTKVISEKKSDLVSFKLKGTGSKGITVKVGVGSKVGYGSCCRSVSPNSTVSFQGHIGDVVYDSEKSRVILKVYDGIEGTVTDLKEYY